MRDILSLSLKNQGFKFTPNHAVDFVHAIVSVSYCQYVLLDSHWASQIDQSRCRLKRAGHNFPMAKVYSRRRNGLERFFDELEKVEF